MDDYFWLIWGCVLVFAIFMVLQAPKGNRLKAAGMMAVAVLLTYLITEVNLPIAKFLVIAFVLFVLLFIGLIFLLVRRMNKILQELAAAQQAYQDNHNTAAYLAALDKCSHKLTPIKWIVNRTTVKSDTAQEIKLWDFIDQEKQRIQNDL